MNRLNDTDQFLLGAEVAHARPLPGGDLSEGQLQKLTDDRQTVAKTTPRAGWVSRMLQAIGTAGQAWRLTSLCSFPRARVAGETCG